KLGLPASPCQADGVVMTVKPRRGRFAIELVAVRGVEIEAVESHDVRRRAPADVLEEAPLSGTSVDDDEPFVFRAQVGGNEFGDDVALGPVDLGWIPPANVESDCQQAGLDGTLEPSETIDHALAPLSCFIANLFTRSAKSAMR